MLHLSQHIYKIWVPQIGRDGVSGRRPYSYLLGIESTLCKTPHFQWFYGKLNQIYEKLRSDQLDPKPALGGPKPVSRTGGSLLRNWNYTSNLCIFSVFCWTGDHIWQKHCLSLYLKYIKSALFIENYLHFMKHCQRHNGPEGWVLLTKVTSLGHITSSYTNLDQTSSESRPSISILTKLKLKTLDQTYLQNLDQDWTS